MNEMNEFHNLYLNDEIRVYFGQEPFNIRKSGVKEEKGIQNTPLKPSEISRKNAQAWVSMDFK